MTLWCKDGFTCPGVWEEHDGAKDVIVVSKQIGTSPVPLGPDEVAVRLPRRILRNADLG
jgi:hypothetical protein